MATGGVEGQDWGKRAPVPKTRPGTGRRGRKAGTIAAHPMNETQSNATAGVKSVRRRTVGGKRNG
jgi:hypothetical protein